MDHKLKFYTKQKQMFTEDLVLWKKRYQDIVKSMKKELEQMTKTMDDFFQLCDHLERNNYAMDKSTFKKLKNIIFFIDKHQTEGLSTFDLHPKFCNIYHHLKSILSTEKMLEQLQEEIK